MKLKKKLKNEQKKRSKSTRLTCKTHNLSHETEITS